MYLLMVLYVRGLVWDWPLLRVSQTETKVLTSLSHLEGLGKHLLPGSFFGGVGGLLLAEFRSL